MNGSIVTGGARPIIFVVGAGIVGLAATSTWLIFTDGNEEGGEFLLALLYRAVQRGFEFLVSGVDTDAAAGDDAFGDQGFAFFDGFEEALFGGLGEGGEGKGEGEETGHAGILAISESDSGVRWVRSCLGRLRIKALPDFRRRAKATKIPGQSELS